MKVQVLWVLLFALLCGGCLFRVGPHFSMSAFEGTYEHYATSEIFATDPETGVVLLDADGDPMIYSRDTWRTDHARPWGTSEMNAVVTTDSEAIGQAGQGISENLAVMIGGEEGNVAGKAFDSFTPGGAAGRVSEGIDLGDIVDDLRGDDGDGD